MKKFKEFMGTVNEETAKIINEAKNIKKFTFEDESSREQFEKELKKLKIKYTLFSKYSITIDMDMIKPDETKVLSVATKIGAEVKNHKGPNKPIWKMSKFKPKKRVSKSDDAVSRSIEFDGEKANAAYFPKNNK
jgi:hypothetical protein